ncbi:hypothetical protein PVL29_016360 [Vitis rotundifolia]|uniref:Uncharacterized protein n=1 Tax=Vitis rotundifolia TaxID=103349 RepID=A0AA38Z7F7_VITRO|nr:hypothetical protein PVL29_016360 [Vitis rotundifolia]
MAEAIVSFAVGRLGDLLIQEASFLHEVSDKVLEIQTELKRMQCFLKDADARQDENEVIHNCVVEIREAAYDAEDIIETFASRVALRRRRSSPQNIFKRCGWIFFEFIARQKVGTEIDAIKKRISSLTTSLQKSDIRSITEGESSSSRNERPQQGRPTYSHLDDKDIIGVEESVKILVEQLVEPARKWSVVAIYGMGGLGKTTLARKVYHHVHVKHHFDHFAWSSISQHLDSRAVVRGILIKLTSPSEEQRREIDNMSDDELFESVRQDWDSLRPAFPLRKEGSKIVITTRNKAVALHVDPPNVFLLQPRLLTEKESWELLQMKALSTGSTLNKDMEELGKKMAKRCNGLPLAIVVLGGLLATKPCTFNAWGIVDRNIKSYFRRGDGNSKQQNSEVSDVLALSYRDLPYHLKPCFLYLAHFHENYKIPTNTLVRMWMAEGIIPEMPDKGVGEETLEDVGHQYLDELIGRCMVQVGVRNSNGRVKTCWLHDLMRDLCLSKAKEENFLDIINLRQVETFSPSMVTASASIKVRRCAIYLDQSVSIENVAKARLVPENTENVTHLRSLLIFYPSTPNTVHWMLRKLSLKNFKLLRVLSLERLSLEEKLLREIGNLIHLKYLSFRDAKLLSFPSSIRNLGCIQTLDLRFYNDDDRVTCPRIGDVICMMKLLRHLYLPRYLYVGTSKVQWDKLSNLETLKAFDARQWAVKDLVQLTKLRKLKINNLNSFKELEVILKPPCPFSLHSLVLDEVSTKMEETDLRQLSMCRHLYELFLGGEISNLPRHDHFPSNLTKLTLSYSLLKQDPIPILERLPYLTILHLFNSYDGEEMVFSGTGFPQLKCLQLSYIEFLKRLRVYKGAMPSLVSLTIHSCMSLEAVPEGLIHITTLNELKFEYMPIEFMERLQVIRGKEGEDFYKVKHLPSIAFSAISENDVYQMLMKILNSDPSDNMKILKELIYAEDDQLPLLDGSTNRRVKLEVLKGKNVFLLISGLDFPDEELLLLKHIHKEFCLKRSLTLRRHEFMWIPIVDRSFKWKDSQQQEMFELLQASMPWYSVCTPARIDKAVIRFIKDEWHFQNKPILVVLDSLGKVMNRNAIHMMRVWESAGYPFTSSKEKALWEKATWGLELLVHDVDPTIQEWIKQKKFICLYGGTDMKWIQTFTTAAKEVASAERIPLEMVYVGKSNHKEQVQQCRAFITMKKLSDCWRDRTMVWFWSRLESMLFSKIQLGRADEEDPLLLEIKKLHSYDKEDGLGSSATVLPTFMEYHAWKKQVPTKGFDQVIMDYHDQLRNDSDYPKFDFIDIE